ncbi:MAG: hypothetical protein E7425_07870 [Ruminococcaceae bacterium]|nr:hypothetical protein [Oscillospiraceae bacterium]
MCLYPNGFPNERVDVRTGLALLDKGFEPKNVEFFANCHDVFIFHRTPQLAAALKEMNKRQAKCKNDRHFWSYVGGVMDAFPNTSPEQIDLYGFTFCNVGVLMAYRTWDEDKRRQFLMSLPETRKKMVRDAYGWK